MNKTEHMAGKFKTERLLYPKHIEKAFVLTLMLFILFFQASPKILQKKPAGIPSVHITIHVQDIPATRQLVRRGLPRPVRPAMPVESIEPEVPEDATIDETIVYWDRGDDPNGNSSITLAAADTIPPKPVMQALPEFPKQSGITGSVLLWVRVDAKGVVRNVRVAQNSTNQSICEQAAVKAAFKSHYLPATFARKPVSMWTRCEYHFDNRSD